MGKFFVAISMILSGVTYSQGDIQIAQKHLENGDIKKSKIILESRLKSNPNDEKAILLLGDIASFEKNWDVALSNYKKLLNNDPGNADFNFRYGGVLGLKAITVSRIKAVVYIPDIKKYLEKATELDPQHIKSRRALVELYMQLPGLLGGSEAKAQRFANELKKIAPLEGALSHAYILKQTGKHNEAKNLVQKALDKITSPYISSSQNYLNYEFGKIAAEYNIDHQQGLKLLDAYIANYNYKDMHAPEWAYYRKAQIHNQLDNKSEATKFIDKALALNSDFEEAKLEKKKIQKL